MKLPRRPVRRSLFAAALSVPLAAPGCAWLDAKMRNWVYRPERRIPDAFRGLASGDEAFDLESGSGDERGTIRLWWLPNADPRAPGLLYLHGTFRNLYRNQPKIEAIRAAGFSVLAVDYRGWGDSAPILPSERTICEDAQSAWQELLRRMPAPNRRVVFGHSMGGGVASWLAPKVGHGADGASLLVIESSFTTLADVGRSVSYLGYPLAWFSSQHFDSQSRIAGIGMPLLMMHGRQDRTVPFALGERLFAAATQPKEFVAFEHGTHSELHTEDPDLYQRSLRKWSDKLRRER